MQVFGIQCRCGALTTCCATDKDDNYTIIIILSLDHAVCEHGRKLSFLCCLFFFQLCPQLAGGAIGRLPVPESFIAHSCHACNNPFHVSFLRCPRFILFQPLLRARSRR